VFNSSKSRLRICLALSSLLFAQASLLEAKTIVNIYQPKTICELIADIEAANALPPGMPSIINLGGLTFELLDDCATAAADPACATTIPPVTVAGCYANDLSYSHGPVGLPEIINNIQIINGRIVRSNAAGAFRIFTVTNNTSILPPVPAKFGELSLFKVTLENGDAVATSPITIDSGNGGAVYVDNGATLSLQSSKIGFNQAVASGGGIYVAFGGLLKVLTSIISHNNANAMDPNNAKAGGGGIYIASMPGVLKQPILQAGLESLISSTVSHNTTPGLGGGINNQFFAGNIIDSTFSYNLTCVSVTGSGECELGANPSGAGGGIYNDVNAVFLAVIQSTFWGNRALKGGGIYNEEVMTTPPCTFTQLGVYLDNNTIASNFAQSGGGGIYNAGFINQLVSNLIAANKDTSGVPDLLSLASGINIVALVIPVVGEIFEGFNLIGDCAGNCGLSNDSNLDIVGGVNNALLTLPVIDPRLHHLNNNGGPTETVALFPDSPAVNNGYNNVNLSFDQRGAVFFRTVAETDIGSYEYQYD